MSKEDNEYILGTEQAELHRLGIQHQVWASEAHLGWKKAGFTTGNTILDLGSGPGFCSKELAYVCGTEGKVVAVDKSQHYIDFLVNVSQLYDLNIDTRSQDFNDLELERNSLDGMYCRWALAWVANPAEILRKVYQGLKPGGKMVIHEYFDWSTHQTSPSFPCLDKTIAACLRSFKEQEGDIDVGREIPKILNDLGMKITTRPMVKMVRPTDFTWQWPKSFYEIYFPKLAEMNYLTEDEVQDALSDLAQLEKDKTAHIFCPTLIEIIAEKL